MESTTARGSWVSLLGWLAPVALIVGGLAFLAADVSDRDDLGGATPANASAAAQAHAAVFVSERVAPGGSATVAGIVPVAATPDGPTLYRLRLVVVSHESLTDSRRTVAYCVRWDVDVSTGDVAEVADVELSTDRGTFPPDERADEWRERCAAEVVL